MIFSHVLYQLSYLGICARAGHQKGAPAVIEARFWAVQNGEKSSFWPLRPGTAPALPALICVDKGAAFIGLLGSTGEEPTVLDLNRIFPMEDVPSARLMKLKAFCLYRAGLLSEAERAAVIRKAKAFIQNPRFRSAEHPRRAA